MELHKFCRVLPKVELHAHLNGSLSHSTMLQLKRYHADSGFVDNTNAFFDEFQIGAGDTRNLAQCFQVFSIAQSLTSTPEAVALATSMTLKEFQDDGCCYIELRSTPRDTPHMSKAEYIETIIKTIKDNVANLTIIARLIVSIDRRSSVNVAEDIVNLAIKYYKKHPDILVGLELSGDPTIGKFTEFVPILQQARTAGLKITLHCAEIVNPQEVLEMLEFKPDRIGHGVCIHPRLGGTNSTWANLCHDKVPVEVCLTSNVNTKSTPNYDSHHFKELYQAGIPIIICTDDKGVFATSLSQEYWMCAETFGLNKEQLTRLANRACQFVFDDASKKILFQMFQNFIDEKALK